MWALIFSISKFNIFTILIVAHEEVEEEEEVVTTELEIPHVEGE